MKSVMPCWALSAGPGPVNDLLGARIALYKRFQSNVDVALVEGIATIAAADIHEDRMNRGIFHDDGADALLGFCHFGKRNVGRSLRQSADETGILFGEKALGNDEK